MESGRRKTLVPSLLFLLILIISLSNQSLILNATIITKCHFPAIFNFGDSNSDTGGLSAAFGQAPPPNGETFFHRPAARYSDGRLLIDFIAQRVGLAYLGAYLDALGSNFTAGANFATGGSTIRPQNTSRHQTFSHGLYTFDIGQNDLTGGLLLNLSIDQVKASVPDILGQFKTVVKDVYDKEGGRSFWIHNTGPIGCLPYVLEHLPIRAGQMDINGCANPFNELAQFFNRRLKELVGQLRKELPEAAITYVDIYKARYALISQASKYGFDHPLRACCGYGGKYNYNTHIGCGGKVENKGKEILVGKSCEDPSVKIIWDGIHYTEAANKWVFDRIVNGSFSDPSVPLQMACHRK
ncbi:Lipase, GDSL [Cynara cardunculus var. scolymus]|uniref:Lipase, GDSL n=1 Tax=Cynara cardunculus var. scolymus TaxID=59895 RepID=A0A103XDW2_CYNCS|nr:Lipase, GDSL [Cynara cardunculus var. scolymus]